MLIKCGGMEVVLKVVVVFGKVEFVLVVGVEFVV